MVDQILPFESFKPLQEEEEESAVIPYESFKPIEPVVQPTEAPVEPSFEEQVQQNPQLKKFYEQTMQQEETRKQLKGEVEGAGQSSREELLSSTADITAIRDYMVRRKGVQYKDKDDEELLDDFITHMRYVNVNEVSTAGEWNYVRHAEEADKTAAGNAYLAYEKLSPMWSNGGLKDAAQGTWDYAAGAILNPSNLIGGIFGRVVSKAATRPATKMVSTMALNAAKDAAKAGATKTVQRQVAKSVLAEAAKKNAKAAALKGIAATTAFDATVAMAQDSVFQHTYIEAGAQEGFNYTQMGFNALFGVVGGGLSAIPEYMRLSAPKLTNQDLRRGAQQLIVENKAKLGDRFKQFADKVVPTITQRLEEIDGATKHSSLAFESSQQLAEMMFDKEDPLSIINLMKSVGAPIKATKEDQAFVNVKLFVDTLQEYDKEIYDTLSRDFHEAFGLHLGEAMDIVGTNLEKGGRLMGTLGNAVQHVNDTAKKARIANASTVQAEIQEGIAIKKRDARASGANTIKYIQSLWRRSLVSHLSTTMLNIQGFGQASLTRTLTDFTQMGINGAVAMGYYLPAKLGNEGAKDVFDRSARNITRLYTNQGYKLRTLLDPYSTSDNFRTLLETSPYAKEQFERSFFAGVTRSAAEEYGLGKNWFAKQGERYADLASKLTLARAQDSWTKSIVAVSELDKVIRLDKNLESMGIKSLDDIYKSGRSDLITEDMWETVVSKSLEDTFSKDYTRGKHGLNQIAKLVESFSSTPVIGFFFPFGRFANNIVAYIGTYSPINAASLVMKAATKGGRAEIGEMTFEEVSERVAQTIVGTSLMAAFAHIDKLKEQDKLQWGEEVNAAGDSIDISYIAPNSIYRNFARIQNRIMAGEPIDNQLVMDLVSQLGAIGYATEVGTVEYSMIGFFQSLPQLMKDPSTAAELKGIAEQQDSIISGKFLANMLSPIADIGAGFLRPLDVPNKIVGMATGQDETVDYRQLEKDPVDRVKGDLLRYVNNIFEVVTGNRTGPEKNVATKTTPARDPNPLATLAGKRNLPPKEPINLLLGSVDYAEWMASERTAIPEYDDMVNKHVTPYLNTLAEIAMDREGWDDLPLERKRMEARKVLTAGKTFVRDLLKDGLLEEDAFEASMRYSLTKANKDARALAGEALGIDVNRINDLSVSEMLQLEAYIDYIQDEVDLVDILNP